MMEHLAAGSHAVQSGQQLFLINPLRLLHQHFRGHACTNTSSRLADGIIPTILPRRLLLTVAFMDNLALAGKWKRVAATGRTLRLDVHCARKL